MVENRSSNRVAQELRDIYDENSPTPGMGFCITAADEIDRLTERLAGAYASVNLLTEMLEAKAPQEATGLQPVRRWNAKYPGISMLEHNGELIRSGFGPYVLAEDYDRVASLLAEAARMIEGYRRAGWITNPASLEQASDFALRVGNSHHE